MREMPLDIGTLHFVGIGGIGMSGIAEILHNLGYQVQGSDLKANANVERLRKKGIIIFEGHAAEHVKGANVVVVSSAVKADNPEMVAAREALIPVVRRAEMLAELMRLKWSIAIGGTHGKTTTTSLVAALLDGANLDPTVINGGIINAYGTNARLGQGDWMVVEADESDGSFTRLPATIAVVTNIDPEHLDFYGSFDALRQAFRQFVENIPFYGFAVMCTDHSEVQALISDLPDRRVITYGFNPQADIRAMNLKSTTSGVRFDIEIHNRLQDTRRVISDAFLPMLGAHNILNTLAAIAIALEMQIPDHIITRALSGFKGVKRRFSRTGVVNSVTIIDDYAHHPVEIAAVLHAARAAVKNKNRVIAVVQPHRYTRLRSLFEEFCTCFNDANAVIVAPVFPAGEEPIPQFDRDTLVTGLRNHGHRLAVPLPDQEALARLVHEITQPGDIVVCLGAGSISQWAHDLPAQLRHLASDQEDAEQIDAEEDRAFDAASTAIVQNTDQADEEESRQKNDHETEKGRGAQAEKDEINFSGSDTVIKHIFKAAVR